MELTKDEQSALLDCMLEMGELLLDAGAEISRVEDTLTRMGKAYGAERVDVFVIPSLISLSVSFGGEGATTQTRRILSNGLTDFYRLEKLNGMSRSCCKSPLPPMELRAQLDRVAAGHKPFAVVLGGSTLAAFSFTVFFGGNGWDGLAAALFAVAIVGLQEYLGRTRLNTVAFNEENYSEATATPVWLTTLRNVDIGLGVLFILLQILAIRSFLAARKKEKEAAGN